MKNFFEVFMSYLSIIVCSYWFGFWMDNKGAGLFLFCLFNVLIIFYTNHKNEH